MIQMLRKEYMVRSGILCFLLLFPFSMYAQDTLRPYRTLRFKLNRNQEKCFGIAVLPGRIYYAEAEQVGIDIELLLLSETGEQLLYRDSPNGLYGPEIMDFAVNRPRRFTLCVRALNDTANTDDGRVWLRLRAEDDVAGRAANPLLRPAQMKKDLHIFRQIREKANSGLYRYRSKSATDSLYAWAYARVKKPLYLTDFYKIVLELTDFEGSCHNNTMLPAPGRQYTDMQKGYFPYSLRYVAGSICMNSDSAPIPAGSRIHAINGLADTLLMRSFYKYFPSDGYNITQKQASSVNRSFGWLYPFEHGACDSFYIAYSLPGSAHVQNITVASVSREQQAAQYEKRHSAPFEELLNPNLQPAYSFRMEGDSAGLLAFRRFDMASNAADPAYGVFCTFLDSVFGLLNEREIPNLIIDIRNNPGGNDPTYEKVFTYLSTQSFRENTEAYIIFRKLPLPRYYAWQANSGKGRRAEQLGLNGLFGERYLAGPGGRYYQHPATNPLWQPDANVYKGQVYVLINEDVASAASHFASLLRGYSNAILVGSETVGGYYGHNGHFPVEYCLPHSGIRTRFSVVHVTQDAPRLPSQPPGRGIIPDVQQEQTLPDFLLNRDTQLQYVRSLIYRKY